MIENTLSTRKPVKSGVPQGSALGPILFLLYVNDIPQKVASHIKLFGDDSKLYNKAATMEDFQTLKAALAAL